MNEEEVKIKYILPWLYQAGIDAADLQFEHTFSLKVGRQCVSVGGPAAKKQRGRFDILVRKGEKNLFIVETKASDEKLTDGDRDQAVSYARLVHPVAPFALVTNGNEYRLYDSITKERIEPAAVKIRGYEATLPAEIISEAQTLFLMLNRANLSLFCHQQVTSELRLVRGGLSEGRKYVPALYVAREAIRDSVRKFRSSTKPGLLVVGSSGSGKTCELASIAELEIETGSPVLFFNGSSLSEGIFEAIAEEFSWTFNRAELPLQVMKRMEAVLGAEQITIIIDAIDEWSSSSRVTQLGVLLRTAEAHRIKVLMSCKESVLESFLRIGDNVTHVDILTDRTSLSPFTEREFYGAVERYREAYQFFGAFESAVLEQARQNPFLLRVLFDVAKDAKVTHLTFSSEQFFQEYYRRSVRKTARSTEAEETLQAIARVLWERDDSLVPEQELRSSLGLRTNESLMDELFEYNILLRAGTDSGERTISFYFQQLCEYLIAFRVLRFNAMLADRLADQFRAVKFPSMRGDVFTLYYRLASSERKPIFDGEVRRNAERYLLHYRALIGKHFPAMRRLLKPKTDKNFGFIGELHLSEGCRVGMHGFRPLEEGDDEVHFVPVHSWRDESNLASLEGAKGTMHYRSSDLGFKDGVDVVNEVVEGELLPQIREMIDHGALNESNNPDLLRELVLESVRNNRGIFAAVLTPDKQTVSYPLRLDAVIECLQREKLRRHFEDEIVRERRRCGEIREQWSGTFVTFSFAINDADRRDVAAQVQRAMEHGDMPVIRSRYIELDELEETLMPAIQVLRAEGDNIAAPAIKGWQKLEALGRLNGSLGRDELKDCLGTLFSAFLVNYRAIVETNFPTLRSCFEFATEPSVTVFLVLGSPTRLFGDWDLSIYITRSKGGLSSVEFVDIVDLRRTGNEYICEVEGIVYNCLSCIKTSLNSFLGRYGSFGAMRLRSLVYSRLKREFEAAEHEFRALVLPKV